MADVRFRSLSIASDIVWAASRQSGLCALVVCTLAACGTSSSPPSISDQTATTTTAPAADQDDPAAEDPNDSQSIVTSILDGAGDVLGQSLIATYMTISPNAATTLCLTATPVEPVLQACNGDANQLWNLSTGTLSVTDSRFLGIVMRGGVGEPNLNVGLDLSDRTSMISWEQGQLTVSEGGKTYALDAGTSPVAGGKLTFAVQQAKAASQMWLLQHDAPTKAGGKSVLGIQILVQGTNPLEVTTYPSICLAASSSSATYTACSSKAANQMWTLLPWGGVANGTQCLHHAGTTINLASCSASDSGQAWTILVNGRLQAGGNLCIVPMLAGGGKTMANPPTLSACDADTDHAQTFLFGQDPSAD